VGSVASPDVDVGAGNAAWDPWSPPLMVPLLEHADMAPAAPSSSKKSGTGVPNHLDKLIPRFFQRAGAKRYTVLIG